MENLSERQHHNHQITTRVCICWLSFRFKTRNKETNEACHLCHDQSCTTDSIVTLHCISMIKVFLLRKANSQHYRNVLLVIQFSHSPRGNKAIRVKWIQAQAIQFTASLTWVLWSNVKVPWDGFLPSWKRENETWRLLKHYEIDSSQDHITVTQSIKCKYLFRFILKMVSKFYIKFIEGK